VAEGKRNTFTAPGTQVVVHTAAEALKAILLITYRILVRREPMDKAAHRVAGIPEPADTPRSVGTLESVRTLQAGTPAPADILKPVGIPVLAGILEQVGTLALVTLVPVGLRE
jgi:hypothetical protein